MPKRKKDTITGKKQDYYYTSQRRLHTPPAFRKAVVCKACNDSGLIELGCNHAKTEFTVYAYHQCKFGKVVKRLEVAPFCNEAVSVRLTTKVVAGLRRVFRNKENYIKPEIDNDHIMDADEALQNAIEWDINFINKFNRARRTKTGILTTHTIEFDETNKTITIHPGNKEQKVTLRDFYDYFYSTFTDDTKEK